MNRRPQRWREPNTKKILRQSVINYYFHLCEIVLSSLNDIFKHRSNPYLPSGKIAFYAHEE